ncbi:antitoxin VbhA family protein [Rhodoflexus caldus]|uniref:antitoxin VbhA family protein n=1 Tax=Rhodoflexus caldus TaxID=2891236 RepID=UPI00202A3959|nr:antitoxin VbhA family protein [Rhodoflexus caldus]
MEGYKPFKATENRRFDLKNCKFKKHLRLENMFNTIEIDRNNLTIMGVKFSDLKTLESTANALGSNMFEGFEPTPKGIEIIRDYVTGKITLTELVALAKQKAYV